MYVYMNTHIYIYFNVHFFIVFYTLIILFLAKLLLRAKRAGLFIGVLVVTAPCSPRLFPTAISVAERDENVGRSGNSTRASRDT